MGRRELSRRECSISEVDGVSGGLPGSATASLRSGTDFGGVLEPSTLKFRPATFFLALFSFPE